VSPSDCMLPVQATFELRDGSRYPGFIAPAFEGADLGALQPQMFVGPRRFASDWRRSPRHRLIDPIQWQPQAAGNIIGQLPDSPALSEKYGVHIARSTANIARQNQA